MRIVIGLLVCSLCATVGGGLVALISGGMVAKQMESLLSNTVIAVLAAGAYILLYTYYERRRITEYSLRGLGRNIGWGLLIGVGLQSVVILVIYISGAMKVSGVNPVSYLLPALAISISSSVFEETLFRGIIFRITEEKLGSYWSLFISGLLFGIMHITNPNSSLLMAIAIAVEAGLMLGAAYMCTRNLWFPIAIHFGWNFAQGGIYGAAVSGNNLSKSLLQTQIQGNTWITGGAFGPEGSVQAILFCVIVFLLMMRYSHRHGQVIKPYWKR